ncbi:MAG: translocation/assembly module TamB [Desulfovibrio sp.]|nr:translocation/assembly module TamB [Desulfovibrio sp.]
MTQDTVATGMQQTGTLHMPDMAAKPPRQPQYKWTHALRWLVRGLVGFVLLALLLLGGMFVALRTPGMQAWLVENINAALQPPATSGQPVGVWARVTHLSGPLPFGADAGLELYDAKGLCLRVPTISFGWKLGALPDVLHFSAALVDATLLRLPESETPQSESSSPIDEAGLRQLLAEVVRSLHALPEWLPEVHLDALQIENFRFPQEVLGAVPSRAAEPEPATARADMQLRVTAGTQGAQVDGAMRLTDAAGAHISLAGVETEGVDAKMHVSLGLPVDGTHLGLDAGAGLQVNVRRGDVADSSLSAQEETGKVLAVLLGQGGTLDVQLMGSLATPSDGGDVAVVRADLTTLSIEAGPLHADGKISFESNTPRQSWLSGGLKALFDITLSPMEIVPADSSLLTGTPFDMLRAPLMLHVAANGPLDAVKAEVSVQCTQAEVAGHTLTDALAQMHVPAVRWRELLDFWGAEAAIPIHEVAPSTEVQLHTQAVVDMQPLQCDLTIFATPQQNDGVRTLHTGLRDLRGNVLGVDLAGNVTTLLPVPLGPDLPGVDGTVKVHVDNWKSLALFLPGAKLDGEATISLELQSQQGVGSATDNHATEQAVALRLNIPRLNYSESSGTSVDIRGLESETVITDIWKRGLVSARLDLARVHQGDMNLNAKVRAQGSLQGPLEAQVETGGFAKSHVHAVWRPGMVAIQRLDASLPTLKLGIAAVPGATVAYGDDGIICKGVDINLKPAGRLRAHGALGAKALDLQLDVEQFHFAPWRALIPELPEGAAEAHLRLSGGMATPSGNLRALVRGLHVPGTAIKPLNFELAGKLERGSGSGALALQLTLDPSSVRALGGKECRVEARVPLEYSKDGPPSPAMQGPLRATVRWSGEVAPLWALLPVHDQRLAGKLHIALDVAGSMEAPSARGFVKMENGRYEHVELGVLLPSIGMRVDLEQAGKDTPGAAKVQLDAADGQGGTVRVAGRTGLDGKGMDITTHIKHLRPLRRRDVRVDLSGDVTVHGEATAPEVRGQLTVNQGVVLLNRLDVAGSVTTLPLREDVPVWVRGKANSTSRKDDIKPAASAPLPTAAQGGGHLDIRLLMPGRFLVEGFGLQSEWKADMHISGAPVAPAISGQVEAAKGQLDILGKVFKLSRGAITFGGGNVANPLLDILLTNQTASLTANMAITGTVRKMQLTLSSDPVLPRDEILARMLFGKSANELGRLENLRLAAAVAQLAGFGSGDGEGGGVLDSTREALGMDVLRFNTSGSDSSSKSGDVPAGTSMEMGKYLTEDVYVGVQQGAKQDSTAFVIQLELTPRANVEVRSEQKGTKGGFNWKYDY